MVMHRRTKGLGAQGMLLAVAVLLFGLAACSNSGPAPTEQSSAATPISSSGSVATPAASGAAATPGAPDWPTTQQAPAVNPCAQCQCPDLLNDSKATSQVVFDNQRGYRYAEAFITCPGQPQPGIFNTTGFNIRPENSRDSIPDSIFQDYSDSAVQQDYGATAVFMEETRYWMMDKLRILLGNNVRNLDGLDTRFGAFTNTAPSASTGTSNAYKIASVTRDSTFYFDAGQPVFMLDVPKSKDAPKGMTFIQQSWVLSAGNFQDPAIGSKLNLPKGWKWRTETLTKDLTINGITENGTANQWKVLQDIFGDSYSACWTTGGQSSCNYQP
jgi:hypothetical protein